MNKKVILAALFCCTVFGFTACDDDDDDDVKTVTITFESANLGETGYINNEAYVESGYTFNNNFDDQYGSWDGFAVSNQTDMETEGYQNQYSVYGNGGANGSKQFGVIFMGFTENPNITFNDGAAFKPVSAQFALTTYTYLSTQKGDSFAKKFGEGDFFRVTVTGIAADGTAKNIDIDAINIDKNIAFTSWTKVDLSELGEVVKLEFIFSSSDNGDWGMNTPGYIAIDNFEVVEQ